MRVNGGQSSTRRFGKSNRLKGIRRKVALGAIGLASFLPMGGKPVQAQQTSPPAIQKVQTPQPARPSDKPIQPTVPENQSSLGSKWSNMDSTGKTVLAIAVLMTVGALGQAASLAIRGLLESRKKAAPAKPKPTETQETPKPSEKPDASQTAEKTPPSKHDEPDEIDGFLKKLDEGDLRRMGLEITPDELRRLLDDDKDK